MSGRVYVVELLGLELRTELRHKSRLVHGYRRTSSPRWNPTKLTFSSQRAARDAIFSIVDLVPLGTRARWRCIYRKLGWTFEQTSAVYTVTKGRRTASRHTDDYGSTRRIGG